MKESIIAYIISGVIYLIALFSIFPLLGNENEVEWFGTGIYHLLLLIGWSSFFVIFLLVGVVLNKSKLRIPWKKTLRVFKMSSLGTMIIVGFGSIKYSIDFNNWQKKSRAESEKFEKKEELRFHSIVDSLQSIINSGSANSITFYKLGLTYRHNGEWESSIENYEEAIKIDSTEGNYHSELAYSQSILGYYDEAISHYELAYSLDSTQKWIKSDIDRCKRMKQKNR